MPKYIVGQDFWSLLPDYHTAFVTINRFVKRDGSAVMGRGIAYQCNQRYKGSAIRLGYQLKHNPTHYLYHITKDSNTFTHIGGFVVKQHWSDQASLRLIEASCKELAAYSQTLPEDENILLNFPGIGNGRRNIAEVQPILDKYLPDNVHVVRKAHVWSVQHQDKEGNISKIDTPETIHHPSDRQQDKVLPMDINVSNGHPVQEVPDIEDESDTYEEGYS